MIRKIESNLNTIQNQSYMPRVVSEIRGARQSILYQMLGFRVQTSAMPLKVSVARVATQP